MLFYRTTSGFEFAGVQVRPEERLENMIHVHGIGQKTGKYLTYQNKRAPLLDRSSCKYFADFVPLPLGGAAFNRQLAAEFKGRNASSKGASKTKFQGSTKYQDDFRTPTPAEVEFGRPKSAKPKEGLSHTLPRGKLMETKSSSHSFFGPPSRLTPSTRAEPPRSNLVVSGIRCGPLTTSYRDDFSRAATPKVGTRPMSAVGIATGSPPMSRCSSAPAGGRHPMPMLVSPGEG